MEWDESFYGDMLGNWRFFFIFHFFLSEHMCNATRLEIFIRSRLLHCQEKIWSHYEEKTFLKEVSFVRIQLKKSYPVSILKVESLTEGIVRVFPPVIRVLYACRWWWWWQ